MPQAPAIPPDLAARRRAARRTALAMAVAALAVYALFMLAGALGQ